MPFYFTQRKIFNGVCNMTGLFYCSCNIAKYKLGIIGAKFVPIILPKVCWKYAFLKHMRLLFNIMSKNVDPNLLQLLLSP